MHFITSLLHTFVHHVYISPQLGSSPKPQRQELPFANILQIPVAGGWLLHILDSGSTLFLDTLVVGVRCEVGTGSQSVVEKAGWGRMDGEGSSGQCSH